ncbi:MAG: tetratricopeptide repeat protein [Bacteroidota bacterium]
MVRSLTYFHSLLIILALASFSQKEWYKKELSEEIEKQYAKQLLEGGSYSSYQGSVPEQMHYYEAIRMDSSIAELWREFGTARVKRGILDEMYYFYGEAVERDPAVWAGFRGYLYLYFYRDFERAIADFNLGDQANGQVDYSQGQNHDYMRGIAYYGLNNYPQALDQLNSYIDQTIEEAGAEWVDVYALLYKGLSLIKLDRIDEALKTFDEAEKIYPKLSDLFYHRARMAFMKGEYTQALELIGITRNYFSEGYYHQRPYVEVLDQIYLQDIDQLEGEVREAISGSG